MKNLSLVLFAIFLQLCFTGESLPSPVMWGGNNHWYEAVYVPDGIDWFSARDAAQAKGGYLATSTSSGENDFLFSLLSDSKFWYANCGPWLGGYQLDNNDEPAGHWAWVTGEPWSFTAWDSTEPNNGYGRGGEDWLLFTSITPQWSDLGWNHPNDGPTYVRSYFVEYNSNPVPLPSAFLLLGVGLGRLVIYKSMRRLTGA